MKNEIMTVNELAEYFRMHPTTIYRMLKKGELPAFRVGNKDWRFSKTAIDKWIADQSKPIYSLPDKKGESHDLFLNRHNKVQRVK